MKKITDISEYNEILIRYGGKGVLSNDYLQSTAPGLIIHDRLYADCNELNAFLFVRKDVGMRMYYYINDIEEKADFSEYEDLVVEILFRKELPKTEVEYLIKNGFRMNLIRDSYAGTYKDLSENCASVPDVIVENAQTLLGVKTACELFNETFDKLSGDFIPESMYRTMLNSGNILMAWNADRSSFLGALHQKKEGNVNVVGHVAVMKHARGRGVGRALLSTFVESNRNPENPERTRYGLWVQRQNDKAVRMYHNMGFRYINKSTISLIK